jgi:hypothetical protein
MFKCYFCGKDSKPREKTIKKVLKTRKKTYPERRNSLGKVVDNGGVGTEIVQEVEFCQKCGRN